MQRLLNIIHLLIDIILYLLLYLLFYIENIISFLSHKFGTIHLLFFIISSIIIFISIYKFKQYNQKRKKFTHGKQIEKIAQKKFKRVAPKHWKYQMNLYKRQWRTDLDIFITHPFKCIIDIKSAHGFTFRNNKIVKIIDGKTELIHTSNLMHQLDITQASVIIVWCPMAKVRSEETILDNRKRKIILCNGDEYYLMNILQRIEHHP